MSNLITQQELMDWLGYQRPGDVERWLTERHIAFHRGRHGTIVTTQAAVDAAFKPHQQHRGDYVVGA